MGLGLFGTLGIGTSGLFTNQEGLNVVSHNIANGSTEGYSRQRVDVKTNIPYCVPGMNSAAGAGQYGTGAHVESVTRVRNSFLDYQIRNESSNFGMYSTANSYLSQIENMFEEPAGTGLNSLMTGFFTAWSDYTNGTNNDIGHVVSISGTLTDDLNHTYTQLQKLKTDIKGEQNKSTFDINQMLDQIDNLNQQIMQVKISGQEPNDLEDSRDLLLDQLSEKFGIDIDKSPNFDGQDLMPQETSGLSNPRLVKSLGKDDVKRFSCIKSIVPEPGSYVDGNGSQTIKLKDSAGNVLLIPTTSVPTGSLSHPSGGMYSKAAQIAADPGVTNGYKVLDSAGKTIATLTKDPATGNLKLTSQLYEVNYNKLGSAKAASTQSTFYARMTDAEAKNLDENRIIWADKDGNAISSDASGVNTLIKDGSTVDVSDIKIFKPQQGSLAGDAAVQQNIDGYTEQLNKLAKTIALAMNAVESGMNNPTKSITASDGTHVTPGLDAVPYFINSDYVKEHSNAYNSDESLNAAQYFNDAGKNWEDYINAGNITINKDLINNSSKLKVRASDDQYSDPRQNIDGGQDKSRAIAISKLNAVAINIQVVDPNIYSREQLVKAFTKDGDVNTIGSDPNGVGIANYFKSTIDDIGVKTQQASRNEKNEKTLLNSIKDQRAAVSGVSLDEEMSSLIQYNHGYQANAKVITTVSQLLDVVIGMVR